MKLHDQDRRLARAAVNGVTEARHQFAQRMRCVARILTVKNTRLAIPLNQEELSDLVQETLVSIWKRLDSYEGLASLETWSYRFCQHTLSNFLRVRSRRRDQISVDSTDYRDPRAPAAADYEEVYRALDRMDSESSQLIRLRHFEERSFREIAEALSIPLSTVKAHHQRAIQRLRELLDHEYREVRP